MGVLDTLKQ
jgi:hypothetical protein